METAERALPASRRYVLPHGDTHVLTSTPGRRRTPNMSLYQLPRLGGQGVLGRLSELMFVDVVRRYLETLPADRKDWLPGVRDPFIGRALSALHRDPTGEWTIESLARLVGLSRSALAERFVQFVGQPPMQYLMNWRMQLAANHLLGGTESVALIANRVGYESEAAFSRAFKKAVGTPPSQWRRQRNAGREP